MKSILELAKEVTQPKPVEPVVKTVWIEASMSFSPDDYDTADMFDNGYFDVYWTPVDESKVDSHGDFDCHCAQDIGGNWHKNDEPQVLMDKALVASMIDRLEEISSCDLIMHNGEYLDLSKIRSMLK